MYRFWTTKSDFISPNTLLSTIIPLLCSAVVANSTQTGHENSSRLLGEGVETRLSQLGFYSLAKRAAKLMFARGRDTGFCAAAPDDLSIHENLHESDPVKLYIHLLAQRMAILYRRYPKSVVWYVMLVDSMTDGITHSEKEPYFYSRLETRAVESVWGRLECGKLVWCSNHHAYPAEGFDDCPECGEEVVVREMS